jgi:spore germination cell wall hydrolase CwlJ-like protein
MFEKTMGTLAVAWYTRSELRERAAGYIKERAAAVKNNARMIKPVVLMFLLIALFCVVTARVKLDNERIREAQEAAAAEEMRLDQERQAAIRASTLAAREQEKAAAAEQHRAECEAVARVLYGTAVHHSEDAQRAVVWCILNRVESSLYPDTIQAVCEQPSQWMGYSPDNPVISGLFEVADEVITAWRSGEYRPMSPDYLFLSWTSSEIVLRTSFNETARTHYWRAG